MKKIKIHKESIKAILSAEWWMFLLIPLVLSGTFFYIFYLMDRPKDNEKIRIFSGFEFTDVLRDKIHTEYKSQFEDYNILETTTYCLDEDTSAYGLTFGNAMFDNYEIIISSKNEYEINGGIYNNLSLELDNLYFNENYEFLTFENKTIGLKIYDSENKNYNEKFTYKESIYLNKTAYAFVSNKTVNSTRIIDEKHSLSEFALKTFSDLFIK